jgi:hypothetical protein
LAATYFLEAALRLARPGELNATSPFEPRQISLADELPRLDRFDVVILANVGEMPRAAATALRSFVEGGGGLLVFGGEHVTAESGAYLLAERGTTQTLGQNQAGDMPYRLKSWDIRHPIFAPFSDPQLGDLTRLAFTARTQLAATPGTAVLARFGDGAPAVIEQKVGKGSIIWLAVAADRSSGDWTSSRLFLPIVYQLVGYQTGLTAGGHVRSVTLEGQAETEDTSPGIEDNEGFMRIVKSSPREAETERATREDFVARFGLKLDDGAAQAPAPMMASTGTQIIDTETWPWIAGLLLMALALESLVANRTAA